MSRLKNQLRGLSKNTCSFNSASFTRVKSEAFPTYTADEIVRLVVEMAAQNTSWGYTRLRGALKNVGYAVGRNTIKRILKERGIEPASMRRREYWWATFIKAHLIAIAAADFFTVEVLSWAGLLRYHVFFLIDLASRRVECLHRIVPLGETHLRRATNEFVQHYRFERNHQGLGNALIEGAPTPANTNGRIERRERLSGVLNFYSRAA